MAIFGAPNSTPLGDRHVGRRFFVDNLILHNFYLKLFLIKSVFLAPLSPKVNLFPHFSTFDNVIMRLVARKWRSIIPECNYSALVYFLNCPHKWTKKLPMKKIEGTVFCSVFENKTKCEIPTSFIGYFFQFSPNIFRRRWCLGYCWFKWYG